MIDDDKQIILFGDKEIKINKEYKKTIDDFIEKYFQSLNNYWNEPLNIFYKKDIKSINLKNLSFENIVKDKKIIDNFKKEIEFHNFFNLSLKLFYSKFFSFFDITLMNEKYGCKKECYNKSILDVNLNHIKKDYGYNIYLFNYLIDFINDIKEEFKKYLLNEYILKKIILIFIYIILRLILLNTSFTFKSNFYDMLNEIKDFIFYNYSIKILLKNNKEFIKQNYCLEVKDLSELKADICNILNRGLTVNIYEDKIYFYNNTYDGFINYQPQELLQGGNNYKEKYLKYKLKYLILKNQNNI